MKKSVPVISNEGKFYDSIKAAAEFNSTAVVSVWNVIHGRQKTTKGKSFRRATPEEVRLARKLSRNKEWDRKTPAEAPRSVQQFRSLAPVAVVDGDGKFYFSIKSAARGNGTFNNCVSRVLRGLQKTANGKTFRHATPEEVKLARELYRRGWDRKLHQPSEKPASPTPKVTDAARTQDRVPPMIYESRGAEKDNAISMVESIEKIQKSLDCLDRASSAAGEQIKKVFDPKLNYTGQILNTTPLVGAGVSVEDAKLLRLQFGRFDVLWREYRARIFAVDTAITEEDVQLYKLLETALNNLQRRYDAARSKRQGG